MLLSAAHRNVILLPVVFLIGVWVGQSRLIDWQSEEQDNPRRTVIRSELEQRTSGDRAKEILASSCMDHFGNKLGNASPTAQKPANSVSANSDLDNSAVIHEQEGDMSRHQLSVASGPDPSWENSESEPIQGFSDMLAPSDENWSESYSVQEEVALESTAIEPSPQSIENDIIRSLEEAGIPTEEIPSRVENVMGMILQVDQQTLETYPSISAP